MGEERWVRASGHPSVLERLHREGEDTVLDAQADGHEENHERATDSAEQARAPRPVGALLVVVVVIVTNHFVLRLRLKRLLLRELIILEALEGLGMVGVDEALEVQVAEALLRFVAGREQVAGFRGLALEQVADVLVDLPEVRHEEGRQRPLDISAPPSDALDRVFRREGPEGV